MDPAEFQALLDAEEHHWWYRGRRAVVRAELDRLGLEPGAEILDAGCGSGRMLSELAAYGSVVGVELNPAGVARARERGFRVEEGVVEELPFPDEAFDLVTSFDVIEHTADDERALAELLRVARPGARLLATVPAYQSLWSAHDVANQHYRRYRRGSLRSAAEAAGWRAERLTHFNTLLLAPAALKRLTERRRPAAAASASDLTTTSPRLDSALSLPMRAEARLLRRGARLPAGLSVLGVFVKPPRAS